MMVTAAQMMEILENEEKNIEKNITLPLLQTSL